MAVKKIKKAAKTTAGAQAQKRQPAKTFDIVLPTEDSIPSDNLQDYTILLYGEKKIGKTAMAARFPGVLALMFEPGAKSQRLKKIDIPPVDGWAYFIAVIDKLEKEKVKLYENFIIDTADVAYDYCMKYVCSKKGLEHPHDADDYGKTWGLVKQEFAFQMTRLEQIGGIIFISHAQEKEVKKYSGEKYNRITTTMGKQASEFLEGIIDIWGYVHYDTNGARVITMEGDEHVNAGYRLEDRFKDRKGQRLKKIPMGRSADQAYKNFINAFNNKL